MKIISETTGVCYDAEECVYFRNTLQSAFYMFYGAKLVDVFVSDDMRMVYTFLKTDHERLKMLWKNASIEKDRVKHHEGEQRQGV